MASADLPADGGLPNAPRGGQQARLQQKPTEIDRILGEVGLRMRTSVSSLSRNSRTAARTPETSTATRYPGCDEASHCRQPERSNSGAVRVLGRWGTDDDLAEVLALIDDPEQVVRNSVAQAVTRRKYVASATALARRLHNPQDRFTMAVRLCELGPSAAPVLVKLLDDPDDEVKIEAVKILEDIGTTAELEALGVRAAAIRRSPRATRPYQPVRHRTHRGEASLREPHRPNSRECHELSEDAVARPLTSKSRVCKSLYARIQRDQEPISSYRLLIPFNSRVLEFSTL